MAISTIGQNGLQQSRILTAVQQPAGAVLQVVSTTTSLNTQNSTTSYVTTGLSASITPTASTSKILVIASAPVYVSTSGGVAYCTIYRGGSNILNANGVSTSYGGSSSMWDMVTIQYLDSPATTSSTTYTIYIKSINTNMVAWGDGGTSSTVITLMEIAA